MNQTNSWKQHFISLPGNEQGNKNMEAFGEAMSSENSDEARVKSLTEEVDTVILIADENREVTVIHSPKNHGGTRTRPTNKVSCLIGTGPQATCVILNEKQAIEDCDIKTPVLDDLIGCNSKTDVIALQPSVQITFTGSASFIPAPWMTTFILNKDSRDPAELIVKTLVAAAAFDATHVGNPEFENYTATNHAEELALWLYGVHSGDIPETRLSIRPEDGELARWCEERHAACILGSLTTAQENTTANPENNAIIAQLTASIANQAEETSEANKLRKEELQLRKDKEDTKKDRLKKLHHSVKNMLMNASAHFSPEEEEFVTIPNLPDSCIVFFNSENVGTADQELSEQFRELGALEANYSLGTCQSLLAGQFIYNSAIEPSNFTAFGFSEKLPVTSNKPNRSLLLYLSSTQGRGKTIKEIARSSKQWVQALVTYEELTLQLHLFMAASTIFFSEESALVPGLNDCYDAMTRNRVYIKTKIASDDQYAAKVLLAIDTRVQRWLSECKIAKERSSVDDSIVNFKDLINDILNSRFAVDLPNVFRADTPPTLQAHESHPNKKRRGEKDNFAKKRGDRGDDNRVINSNQFEAFKMKPNDDWRNFCGEIQQTRPFWIEQDKTFMCHRWHIKGYCFADCANRDSHVGKEKVSADKEKDFGNWIKKGRGRGNQ